MWTAVLEGVSIEEICRRVYPQAATVEKKHRVAVLQVLHRLRDTPPRPFDDRIWMAEPAKRRGYWTRTFIEGFRRSDPRTDTAYHEAGHALAILYCGYPIDRVFVRSGGFTPRMIEKIMREGGRYTSGFVESSHLRRDGFLDGEQPTVADPYRAMRALIVLLSGPIAAAHYAAQWPLRQRGVSQTYRDFLVEDGRPTSDMDRACNVVAALSDNSEKQDAIFRMTQKQAQALIRSEPGWRFVKTLAAKMLDLKHGSLGSRRVVAVFREAFGRRPPTDDEWRQHWPPRLLQMQKGWLPPEIG